MKKLLFLSVALLFSASMLFAQQKGVKQKRVEKTPEERTEMCITKMNKDLSLSAEQQSQLKSVILEREQQRDARREQMKGKKEEMKASRDAERENMDAKLKEILTPEQYAKHQQIMQDRKENMGQKKCCDKKQQKMQK